jgi:hypothetical protein
MQVLAPTNKRSGARRAVIVGTLVGATLFVGGLTVAYLTFGTPFITRFMPGPRPETSQLVAGMLAWTFALIAPAAFIMAGAVRLVTVWDDVARARRPSPTARAASRLSDEYAVMPRVRMPDGHLLRELVLGPFGVAVMQELPPPAASRHQNGVWEARAKGGRWIPIDDPLERAAADAERVRHWLADDGQDFIVKVYAAVIAPDTTLPRSPACAVVTPEQIPAWLASLPAQKSLSDMRRSRLVQVLRAPG